MSIADVMTRNPKCCTPETSITEAARQMDECDCGMIPVVEADGSNRPIGSITDRDIACRVVARGENPADHTVGECMTTPASTISEQASLEDAAHQMERDKVRRLIVTDASGACCGVVAQADLARAHSAFLQEMVEQVSQAGPRPRA